MSIEFVPYKKIDFKKWDDCILNATNSLIYARSFYLDAIADNWDALILNDYEAVMPLVWRKKWGIRYLFQPSFVQQLGIFFKRDISPEVQETFISIAFEQFRYIDTTINYLNNDLFLPAGSIITQRNNYVLSLNRSYEDLYTNYDAGFTKSLRRIKKFGLVYATSTDVGEVLELYTELYSRRLESVTERDIRGFEKICISLAQTNHLIIRQAWSPEQELLAVVLLLKDDRRLYNIISCITAAGKKKEANYFLYDQLIKEFSGRSLLLDLEGSDKKGIAAFYQKFSPVNQPYFHIKQNDLHPVLKLLKH